MCKAGGGGCQWSWAWVFENGLVSAALSVMSGVLRRFESWFESHGLPGEGVVRCHRFRLTGVHFGVWHVHGRGWGERRVVTEIRHSCERSSVWHPCDLPPCCTMALWHRQAFKEGPFGVGGFAATDISAGSCIGRLPYPLVLCEQDPWRATVSRPAASTEIGATASPEPPHDDAAPSALDRPMEPPFPPSSFAAHVWDGLAAAVGAPGAHPVGDPVCMVASLQRLPANPRAPTTQPSDSSSEEPIASTSGAALTLSVSDSRYLLYAYMVAVRGGHVHSVGRDAIVRWGPYLSSLPIVHHLPMAWTPDQLQVLFQRCC